MTGNAILREQGQCEQVLSLNKELEEQAMAGEWSQVEELVQKRNTILKAIEGSGREAALLAARQTTLQVQRLAEAARQEVAEKLSQLQRGRKATDSYLAHA